MQQRIDSLAQQVEHNTFNVGVLGSSPRRITQKKAIILKKVIAFFIFVQMVPDEVPVLCRPWVNVKGQRKNLRDLLFRHKF